MYLRPGLLGQLSGGKPHEVAEDFSLNHSAALYSAMIGQNYISPDVLISPVEVSNHVREKMDYDWNVIDPTRSMLWDETFVMRLHDTKLGANAPGTRREPAAERHRRRLQGAIGMHAGVSGRIGSIQAPPQMIGQPKSESNDRQRRVDGTLSREDGAAGNVEIV